MRRLVQVLMKHTTLVVNIVIELARKDESGMELAVSAMVET